MFFPAAAGFLVSPFLAVAALVVVHRSRGRLLGKGIAAMSLCLWLIIGIVLPALQPTIHTVSPSSVRNLKQIHPALEEYYYDNNNHYPPSLNCLVPKHVTDLSVFQFRGVKAKRMEGKFDEQLCSFRYIYYPDDSARLLDLERAALVFDKGINYQMEGMYALFSDGSVKFYARAKFIAMLGELAGNEKLSMPTRDSVRKTLAEVLAEGPVKRASP